MLNITDYPKAEKVFSFFSDITKIPRGSGNRTKITEYLVQFAKDRVLEVIKDEYDNVIIKKSATPGYESRPTVIIQSHTDMVAEKTPDCPLDMARDGLITYRDGDFIRAKGTSLGGDDGIGVAYTLAILDSSTIPHPNIEALFTSDEEIGLIGASKLDTSKLQGKILINVDSDLEGIFTVGCAGGLRVDSRLGIEREACGGKIYELTVGGLLGGHSGVEIDKNRANAIKIIAEIITNIPDARLIDLKGGNADNAIPRDAVARFSAFGNIDSIFEASVNNIRAKINSEETGFKAVLSEATSELLPQNEVSTKKVLSLINSLPTGVIEMSQEVSGLVETSLNIGIAETDHKNFYLAVSLRSSKNEEKKKLEKRVTGIAEDIGATVSTRGEYPAWEFKKDSRLLRVMCEVYEKIYSKSPVINITHAGLECGIFADKMDGVECVSIGPDNFDIHTPNEHLSISSTSRVYELILEILKNL